MKLFIAAIISTIWVAGCSSGINGKLSIPDVKAKHDTQANAAITKWAETNTFNGVVAVRYPGEAPTTLAFGEADRITSRDLTTDSIFQTGSVGKFLTSIAAFAMAEEGLVDLNAPISEYLPYYRKDIAKQVTLAQLMSNRSGISDKALRPIMGNIIGALKQDPEIALEDIKGLPQSMDDVIANYLSDDLAFKPGSQFDYANSNWIIVPRILETVSGKTYGAILKEYVFEPAGMKNSGTFTDSLYKTDKDRTDIAIGYNAAGKHYDGDYPLPVFIGGGAYVNAQDMIALLDALYDGKLLNSNSLKSFSSIQTPEENYAFGGRIKAGDKAPNSGYSWQSGSNGATNMVAIYNIDTGYSFTALSNRAQDQGEMFDLGLNLENRSR